MSRATGSKKHIHTYRRVDSYGHRVWACAAADCTHFMPLNVEGQIFGKKSICNECKGEFYLDEEALQMDEPTCYDCRHPQSKIIIEKIDELDAIFTRRGIK